MKIEYGIEIPQRKPLNGKGRDSIYPFHSMGLGDSFSVQKAWRNKVATAAYSHGRRYGRKFATRECPKNPENVRVWRVE
jgi:hypothetical protein